MTTARTLRDGDAARCASPVWVDRPSGNSLSEGRVIAGLTAAATRNDTMDGSAMPARVRRDRPVARRMARALSAGVAAAVALAALVGVAGADLDVDANVAFDSADLAGSAVQRNENLGAAVAIGDFDGDGHGDIAVGSPGDGRIGGSVRIVPGSSDGPVPAASLLIDQDTLFGGGAAEAQPRDRFGHAVAAGDFDADGFDDIAIGAPLRDLPGAPDAGAVHVVYGSPDGLTPARSDVFTEADVVGRPGPGDVFGFSLAVGDFDADGRDDLAVGKPGEDLAVRDATDAGAVNVIYGTPDGLTPARNRSINQIRPIVGLPQDGDEFGRALAAGDFDGDGHDDLAIGIPYEDVGGATDAGKVAIVSGSPDGLIPAGNRLVSQRGPVVGRPEAGDLFGWALVAADFDDDGIDDLAVGVPGEGVRGRTDAGAVNVLYGTARGIGPADNQLLSQRGPVVGIPERGDQFGRSLAAGDLDRDGVADLVVGVPGESVRNRGNAGALVVYDSNRRGIEELDATIISQRRPIFGLPQRGDRWAEALAVGDVNGDDAPDLAVGVPLEDRHGTRNAGQLHVVFNDGANPAPELMVAFYGHPSAPVLGVAGEGPPSRALSRLLDQAAPYAASGRETVPVFEMIATLVTAAPGADGLYRSRADEPELRAYLDEIRTVGGRLVLDIQPGRADVVDEARAYENLLIEPDVGLALDPEWVVGPTQTPAGRIGTLDAADINRVSRYLSRLAADHGLPPRILIIHRFRAAMVTNTDAIVDRPGVRIIFHADGEGGPAAKIADYDNLLPPRFERGFKIFYDEDTNRLTPREVLARLDPLPVYVSYQ